MSSQIISPLGLAYRLSAYSASIHQACNWLQNAAAASPSNKKIIEERRQATRQLVYDIQTLLLQIAPSWRTWIPDYVTALVVTRSLGRIPQRGKDESCDFWDTHLFDPNKTAHSKLRQALIEVLRCLFPSASSNDALPSTIVNEPPTLTFDFDDESYKQLQAVVYPWPWIMQAMLHWQNVPTMRPLNSQSTILPLLHRYLSDTWVENTRIKTQKRSTPSARSSSSSSSSQPPLQILEALKQPSSSRSTNSRQDSRNRSLASSASSSSISSPPLPPSPPLLQLPPPPCVGVFPSGGRTEILKNVWAALRVGEEDVNPLLTLEAWLIVHTIGADVDWIETLSFKSNEPPNQIRFLSYTTPFPFVAQPHFSRSALDWGKQQHQRLTPIVPLTSTRPQDILCLHDYISKKLEACTPTTCWLAYGNYDTVPLIDFYERVKDAGEPLATEHWVLRREKLLCCRVQDGLVWTVPEANDDDDYDPRAYVSEIFTNKHIPVRMLLTTQIVRIHDLRDANKKKQSTAIPAAATIDMAMRKHLAARMGKVQEPINPYALIWQSPQPDEGHPRTKWALALASHAQK